MSLSMTEIFGILAVAMGIAGQVLYIVTIFQGKTHPHFFTWIVWTILGGIGFAAMVHDHAGPAMWTLGTTAFLCFSSAVLSLKFGEKTVTRGDKIALVASLSAIVPWLLTSDPLGSVILISIIDAVALYPTARKSWHKPWSESLFAYNLGSTKFALALLAIENFTLVNALYPGAIVFINTTFVVMCLMRRKLLAKKAALTQ